MTKTYFITGTDTEVGKTFATRLIIQALVAKGHLVAGLKPIASDSKNGVIGDYQGLINDDAKQLMEAANVANSYEMVNPLVFADAIAPHIAAEQKHINLDSNVLTQLVEIPDADIVLIEGAGGWLTPLNQKETYADWVIKNNFEVVLVIGMKLGCLNHAQLTAAAIKSSGLKLKGWVANQLDSNMQVYQENLSWLKAHFSEPLLAEIGYQQSADNFKIQLLEELI